MCNGIAGKAVPRMAAKRIKNNPTFVQPMAAEAGTTLPEGPEWLYELKLDGSPYSWTVSDS
jgi:ATP-dependent DNA ligase